MLPTQTTKTNNLSVIAEMDTQQLKQELAKTLNITADYLVYIAAIWQELEMRGEDMSSLQHGMMAYIPMIATKQLDARLVVDYAGQKTLLSALAKLPYHQQIKLAQSGTVDITELSPDGSQIINTTCLSDLSARQVYQVFGDGELKTPEQQYRILLAREAVRKTIPGKKTYRMTSNIKPDGQVLVIAGKHGVSIDLIKQIIAKMETEK